MLTFLCSILTVGLLPACEPPSSPEGEVHETLFVVNGAEAVLAIGDTLRLQLAMRSPLPRPIKSAIVWESSHPEVARVGPDGLLEMRAAGSAVITGTHRGLTAPIRVSSTAAAVSVGPTITLAPRDATLTPGSFLEVSAVVTSPAGDTLPATSLTWSSSDPAVASVVGGRVEALSQGGTRITAAGHGTRASMVVRVVDDDGVSGAIDRFRAFPEAEGYGAEALMTCDRRSVQVLKVVNTNDTGPGSLSNAVGQADPARLTIVVFSQGGTYRLSPPSVGRACLYIAGQTAPGGGVQLHSGASTALFVDPRQGTANDLVVRHVRFRSSKGTPGRQDVVSIQGGRNIVFDHVSAQFGNDEVFSLDPSAIDGTSVTHVTVQHSIIAAGLRSTGSLVMSPRNNLATTVSDVSMHHNLWAHTTHRNPRLVRAFRVQLVNNVVYNWKGNVGGLEEGSSVDIVGNTFKAGPWTSSQRRESRIFHHDTLGALSSVHIARNVAQPYQPSPTGEQRVFVKYQAGGGVIPGRAFVSEPFGRPRFAIAEQAASQAYATVTASAGASGRLTCEGEWVSARDALDQRIIGHVVDGTGPSSDGEMDHPDDLGGLPSLAAGTPCPDRDSDGMPDAFEDRHGLDKNDPADASHDPDGDGYVNIEEFVNGTKPRS